MLAIMTYKCGTTRSGTTTTTTTSATTTTTTPTTTTATAPFARYHDLYDRDGADLAALATTTAAAVAAKTDF